MESSKLNEIINAAIKVYAYGAVKRGNKESGDTYLLKDVGEGAFLVIADGLGSGKKAFESAAVIYEIFEYVTFDHTVDELMNACNEQMKDKRGAAVTIVKVDYVQRQIEMSAIGNVRVYVQQPAGKMIYPIPQQGYLSGRPQKVKVERFDYEPGALLFMHSDGITMRSPKQTLQESCSACQLAFKIYQNIDFSDDATFITAKLL